MHETRPVSRLSHVDGLRALSALWVIVYDVWRFNHQPDLWSLTPLVASGHLGVEVFMVLSGFCLFYPIADKRLLAPGYWREFFRRRALRILPPYYAAIAYAIALPVLLVPLFARMGIPFNPPALPSAWQLFTHVTMIHNLLPGTQSGINPSFWSLSLESQFYAVFPLVALAILRFGRRGVLGVLAGALVYRLAVMAAFPVDLQTMGLALNAIFGRLFVFTAGMGAARLVRRGITPRMPGGLDSLWGLAILPTIALGFYWYFHPIGALPLSDACLGLAVASALVRLPRPVSMTGRWLSVPWLVGLGEISYSFYLLDRPTCFYVNLAIADLVPGDPTLHMGLTLLIGGALSVGLATAFYRWIERPFMVRRRPRSASPGVA